MDTLNLSLAINGVLAAAALLLLFRMVGGARRMRELSQEASYARGFAEGRKELLDSLRYEREIYECRRTGLVKKETALKIRETVMLGNLRLAHSDHEVVLTSEVSQENIWQLVDRTGNALIGPDLGSVVRTVAPNVRKLFSGAG